MITWVKIYTSKPTTIYDIINKSSMIKLSGTIYVKYLNLPCFIVVSVMFAKFYNEFKV